MLLSGPLQFAVEATASKGVTAITKLNKEVLEVAK
jgi:hypothetical protein